jgi:hypothetical protein
MESYKHSDDEEIGEFLQLDKQDGSSKWSTAFACITFASIIAGACALFYYVHSSNQKALEDQAKLNADKAVNVLSPGTEEAWTAYVDRRVAAAIQIKAGAILVTDDSNEARFVSRNTPYQVKCAPMESLVEFGYGDNSVTVPIYGWIVDREAESPPPLGVIESSVAAANLSRTLCERISASLSKFVSP